MSIKFDEFQQKYIDFDLPDKSVLLVKAVAGAGKSTSSVAKIEKLIDSGVKPEQIVLATFSNRMGSQAKRKLKKQGIEGVIVGTIHSIVYNKYRQLFPKVTVLTEWESTKLIRDYLPQAGIYYQTKKEGTAYAQQFFNYLSFFRANLIDPNEKSLWQFFNDTVPFTEKNFKMVYNWYELYKKKNNLLDFDDLVSEKVLLPEMIDKQVKYVFHDEAQDASKANHFILESLFPNASIILIYDNMQKLYSFRYAYSEPMDNPEQYFGKEKQIFKLSLPYNYRSDGIIVKVSNKYRELVDDLVAIPYRPETKGAVKITTLKIDTQVGNFIVKQIRELRQQDPTLKFKDFVILVRKSSFIKTILEPSFVRANLPYKVRTPLYKRKFFEVPINNFFISVYQYLISGNKLYIYSISDYWIGIGESFKNRLLANPSINDPKRDKIDEFISILNARRHNLKSVKDLIILNSFLKSFAEQHFKQSLFTEKQLNIALKTFSNFIKQLIEEEGITDIEELVFNIVQRIEDYDEENSDKIEMTTIHQYKGLENKIVFVTDMCDTSFEFDDSTYSVFYTAITRPMDKLFIINYENKNTFKLGTVRVKPYPKFNEFINNLKKG